MSEDEEEEDEEDEEAEEEEDEEEEDMAVEAVSMRLVSDRTSAIPPSALFAVVGGFTVFGPGPAPAPGGAGSALPARGGRTVPATITPGSVP